MSALVTSDRPYAELRAGWQRVADALGMDVHVVRDTDGKLRAMTNARDAAAVVETIRAAPVLVRPLDGTHGLSAVPGGAQPEPEKA